MSDSSFIKKFPTLKDLVYLLFEVRLTPGETVTVRPSSAIRYRKKNDTTQYFPPVCVAVTSVKPFKAHHIAPRHGDDDSLASWTREAGVYFKKIETELGRNELDYATDLPAWQVSHRTSYSTSLSASDVVFIVVNRGDKPVDFTGHVEGVTLSDLKAGE